jgi:endonuclease/exonuclease/phosphatase family metal-dependent hydrolase
VVYVPLMQRARSRHVAILFRADRFAGGRLAILYCEKRVVVTTLVDRESGLRLGVIGAHLQHVAGPAVRKESIREFTSIRGHWDAVLPLGDFNTIADEDRSFLQALSQAGHAYLGDAKPTTTAARRPTIPDLIFFKVR